MNSNLFKTSIIVIVLTISISCEHKDSSLTPQEIERTISKIDSLEGSLDFSGKFKLKDYSEMDWIKDSLTISKCIFLSDSLGSIKKYAKTDFDGNGKTDYLAIGGKDELRIIVLLDKGDKLYEMHDLNENRILIQEKREFSIYPKIRTIEGTPVIDLYYEAKKSPPHSCERDSKINLV